MSARPRAVRTALLAAALLASGCGNADRLALRYRTEQLMYKLQKAEAEMRLSAARPDTAELLGLRAEYRKVAAAVKPPYIGAGSEERRKVGRDVLRLVGAAELKGAEFALLANRPDLALEQAEWLIAHAEGDTLVSRQADFLAAGSLRAMGRIEQAVERYRAMLGKYPPNPPPPGTASEDAILAVPEMMAESRRAAGDEAGAAREIAYAVGYYEGLLRTPRPPMLEALIRSRLVRAQLDQSRPAAAIEQVAALERLVAANPPLKPLEPELRYSRAKIHALTSRDRSEGIAMLQRFAADHPKHPLAPRAHFDAAVLLEDSKRYEPALEQYRAFVAAYPRHPELAPIALFRQAMLEDRTGHWDRAKATLESIPVKFPSSQAAAEAPFMIAKRTLEHGDREAAKSALARAVEVYRDLINRDTTSVFTPVYRFNILRAHLALGQWDQALAAVDALASRNRRHPYTAQALLEGAKVANANRQKNRAAGYLQQFLEDYPDSPVAADVRRERDELAR